MECAASGQHFLTGVYSECCAGLAASVLLEDASLCLHACCCYKVRVADTYSSAGLGNFTTIFLQMLMLAGATRFGLLAIGMNWVFVLILSDVALALYISVRRGQVRARLGGSTCSFMDFVCVSYCPWCTACQEARHVDAALGVQVRCCCVLEESAMDSIPLVGLPVSAEMSSHFS